MGVQRGSLTVTDLYRSLKLKIFTIGTENYKPYLVGARRKSGCDQSDDYTSSMETEMRIMNSGQNFSYIYMGIISAI
jgi:hypothetical protein